MQISLRELASATWSFAIAASSQQSGTSHIQTLGAFAVKTSFKSEDIGRQLHTLCSIQSLGLLIIR